VDFILPKRRRENLGISEFNGTIIFPNFSKRGTTRKLLRHSRLELTILINTALYFSFKDGMEKGKEAKDMCRSIFCGNFYLK